MGDSGERSIGLAVVEEPLLKHLYRMGRAVPFADEARAGREGPGPAWGWCRFGRSLAGRRPGAQLSSDHRLQPAGRLHLHPIGSAVFQQSAAQALGRRPAMCLFPKPDQFPARETRDRREFPGDPVLIGVAVLSFGRVLVYPLRMLLCGKPLDEGAFGDPVSRRPCRAAALRLS